MSTYVKKLVGGLKDEKVGELIKKNMAEVHQISMVVHGKYHVPFTVSALWYRWGPTKRIVWWHNMCHYDSEESDLGFLHDLCAFGRYPDELESYTKKWGFCNIP